MKNTILSGIFILSFLLIPFYSIASEGPGNPPAEPGTGELPIGGGTPIGGGSIILMGLAVAYAGKKLMLLRKEDQDE